MKIRRYLGSNTQEAILKVKMDLGNEAVILNTRKIRKKGFLKLFAKPMIEVLAAVDEEYGSKKERDEKKNEATVQTVTNDAKIKIKYDEKEEKITHLENKVNNIESLLQKVVDQIQGAGKKAFGDGMHSKEDTYSKVFGVFYNNLFKHEVEPEIAKKIVDTVSEKLGRNASFNEAASMLQSVIAGMLGKPETINFRKDGKPTVVIFVGPTGVGKTTTMAKVSANYALNYGKSVGLITADTYRIAAVEQLKTYAEILGMPLSVIYSPNEIKDEIEKYADKDIIFIDTAGRSSRNTEQFDELKSLVLQSGADEIFLLLSATTSIKNCKEILENYSFIKNYKLIFTKIDESPISGIILNARHLTNNSLSYITTGQNVPDDIEVADVDRISKNLLGSIR